MGFTLKELQILILLCKFNLLNIPDKSTESKHPLEKEISGIHTQIYIMSLHTSTLLLKLEHLMEGLREVKMFVREQIKVVEPTYNDFEAK